MTEQKKKTTKKNQNPYKPSRNSQSPRKISSGIKAGSWLDGLKEELDKE